MVHSPAKAIGEAFYTRMRVQPSEFQPSNLRKERGLGFRISGLGFGVWGLENTTEGEES